VVHLAQMPNRNFVTLTGISTLQDQKHNNGACYFAEVTADVMPKRCCRAADGYFLSTVKTHQQIRSVFTYRGSFF